MYGIGITKLGKCWYFILTVKILEPFVCFPCIDEGYVWTVPVVQKLVTASEMENSVFIMNATEVFKQEFIDRAPQDWSDLISSFAFLRWTVLLFTRKSLETEWIIYDSAITCISSRVKIKLMYKRCWLSVHLCLSCEHRK
jgi:hypothetical protein